MTRIKEGLQWCNLKRFNCTHMSQLHLLIPARLMVAYDLTALYPECSCVSL